MVFFRHDLNECAIDRRMQNGVGVGLVAVEHSDWLVTSESVYEIEIQEVILHKS